MRDVADAAGVSVAVVSYCFNHPERVAAVTRERVLATAASLGYTGANPAARALRTGRTGLIGLIWHDERRSLLDDECDVQVARGVAHVCTQAGLRVLLSPRIDDLVDGAITLGAAQGRPGHPMVAVGDVPPAHAGTPRVGSELATSIMRGTQALAEMGHRRFAVIGFPGDDVRRAGVFAGLPSGASATVFEAASRRRGDGDPAARAVLAQNPRATAVIALGDEIAMRVLEICRVEGIRVPDDVSVMGVDDLPTSGTLGLTTVAVPYREKGEIAMGILTSMLAGNAPPRVPPLEAPLMVRRTTGPPPD